MNKISSKCCAARPLKFNLRMDSSLQQEAFCYIVVQLRNLLGYCQLKESERLYSYIRINSIMSLYLRPYCLILVKFYKKEFQKNKIKTYCPAGRICAL
jgi:hypothetical protein